MGKSCRVLILAALCVAPNTLLLEARSQTTRGVIEGIVREESGAALPGSTIVIRNLENGTARRLTTDRAGRYRSPALPLGNYEITAQSGGFSQASRTNIVLQIAQTLNVSFVLRPALGGLQLLSMRSFIEQDRKQPSTTLNRAFVQNLPVRSRKFLDLGVLVPGATEFGDRDSSATADFAGVNHFYSNMLVDGVESYQAWSNLPKAKFLVPYEFSQNAIQEFQVMSGNFNAEFGRSAGGLVNVVTKSGTNDWHGDAFYLLADSALNAIPRFAASKPDTREQLFGGSLGGPIVRDRLFIFGNYDQQIRSEPMIVTPGTVLDGFDATLASITNAAERQRFIEAGDMVRSLVGEFERDIDQYTGLIRSDWNSGSRHSFSARFNYHRLNATNIPENGFTTPIVSGMAVTNNGRARVANGSFVPQWTAVLSPNLLNEMRMQYADGTERQIANSEGPQVRIGSGRSGISFGRREIFPSRLREKRLQWIDNVTIVRGSHEIKAGIDLQRVSDTSFSLTAIDGSYQFNSLRDFANGRYNSYTQGFGVPENTTVNSFYSVFVQDNFKPASNLSMNLGLRYEFQKLDQPDIANPQFPRTGVIPQDKNNFAPRVALAWQPLDSLVVRTSYGIYYGPLPVGVNSIARTQNGVTQNLREFRGSSGGSGGGGSGGGSGSGTPGAPVYPAVFPHDDRPQNPTAGSQIIVFSPDFVAPYIQQVNLEIEKELASNLSITSGWLYTKGTRLRSNEDMNLFPPTPEVFEIRDTARNIFGLVTLPGFGGPASRPFPFFGQIAEFRSDSNSVYHAFFVQGTKHYSGGLQFFANYTLSKLIDRGAAPGNQIQCCTSEDPYSPGEERGLGRRDQRHRFNLAAVWDAPAGLRFNAIMKAGSGRPITPTVTGDSGGDLNGNAIRGGDRAPFFGPSTFTGPGYATVDVAVYKQFSRERQRVEFGLEIFNLFNRSNFLRPAPEYYMLTNVPGGIRLIEGPLASFGRPQDATRSREIQMAVRFAF